MLKYSTIESTEKYILKTSKDHSLLIRKSDGFIVYIDEDSVDMLIQVVTDKDFNSIASTFKFIDPVYEK